VVAHDRGHALACRVPPWLRHESGNRSAEGQSSSSGVGRHPGAAAAVLVVPGNSADAEDPRFACVAAGGKGGGIEAMKWEVLRGDAAGEGGDVPKVPDASRQRRGFPGLEGVEEVNEVRLVLG
jgi:hypothetical protein